MAANVFGAKVASGATVVTTRVAVAVDKSARVTDGIADDDDHNRHTGLDTSGSDTQSDTGR